MWIYEKKLQCPVNVRSNDLRIAKILATQYGGPDSELSAGCRYLTQRYSMPINSCKAALTDIGTEELAHWEIIGTMIHQILCNSTPEQVRAAGLEAYFCGHKDGVFPVDGNGNPWTAAYIACTGDPVADLTEDMAAEQKARAAYERILDLCDEQSVQEPIIFLRQREVVHFQRFGECLNRIQCLWDRRPNCRTDMMMMNGMVDMEAQKMVEEARDCHCPC